MEGRLRLPRALLLRRAPPPRPPTRFCPTRFSPAAAPVLQQHIVHPSSISSFFFYFFYFCFFLVFSTFSVGGPVPPPVSQLSAIFGRRETTPSYSSRFFPFSLSSKVSFTTYSLFFFLGSELVLNYGGSRRFVFFSKLKICV